jgi:DNA mismatch repair ATPase MutS
VQNNVCFDSSVSCYILTGPNNGGKTVFMRTLGLAQLMFQLGLPVPASSAKMELCDRIYYVVPKSQESSGHETGRFESECIILSDI